MNDMTSARPIAQLISTRLVRHRKDIPEWLRNDSLRTIRRAMEKIGKAIAPSPSLGELSETQARMESLKHLERLWEQCETTFAAFDAVAADEVREAYDSALYLGGKYPKAPLGVMSSIGSVAGMCADAGG